MSVESDFYALLDAGVSLSALVGERIYPDVLPEDCAYPAVVYARNSTDPIVGISGQVFGDDVGLSVGCWGETRTQADGVADAIQSLLSGTAFARTGRESAYDPDTGLFASILTVTTFATS